MIMLNSAEIQNGVDKIRRYKWKVKDAPGKLMQLSKELLQIHPAYQRDTNKRKVLAIASAWSWIACGAVVVGRRGGEFWVIDGQHRVLAAKHRSDIRSLSCVVFETVGVEEEAVGFLNLNTERKPLSSFAKLKAMVAANDETAVFISDAVNKLGISFTDHQARANQTKSVTWSLKKAKEDRDEFVMIMKLCHELSGKSGIKEILLDGIWYINNHIPGGLSNKHLLNRLKMIGGETLIQAATRAAAYYTKGGSAVWADGMLKEINKRLGEKKKYEFLNQKK